MATKPKQTDEFFSPENEVQTGVFKFDKVGDAVKGILLDVRKVRSELTGTMQNMYDLQAEDGSVISVWGRKSIDASMRAAKIGQMVGFRFVEEKKSTKKGFHPFKRIVAYLGPAPEANVEVADEPAE